MRVEEEIAGFKSEKDSVLTVGVFDGVHLGHKHLISKLVGQARERGMLAVVVTFRQHPQELMSPQARLPFLTNLSERSNLLKNEGVDTVVPLTFTEDLSKLSALRFISLLQKYLRMHGMVIGPDFALGKGREGDVAALRRLGKEMDFSVSVVPPLITGGEVISSTAIRKALADGDVAKVSRLAGRPFSLNGRVVTGAGRGVGLGFPTANLDVNQGQALPADGVYASWAYINDKAYQSATNVGTNPTFGDAGRSVETYIFDYQNNLYGSEIKVDFVERLRDEKKFSTAEELKKQMAEDVKQGKTILSTRDAG